MRIFDRLRFWLKARNRHGIHSPFVYRFLDTSLYRKDLRSLPPQKRLLIAAVDHFGIRSAHSEEPQGGLTTWLKNERPGILWGAPPYDLLLCESPCQALAFTPGDTDLLHNDSVVFLGNLRKDAGTQDNWKEMTRKPQFPVILETYGAGLLFARKQQAPQHFRIRI